MMPSLQIFKKLGIHHVLIHVKIAGYVDARNLDTIVKKFNNVECCFAVSTRLLPIPGRSGALALQ